MDTQVTDTTTLEVSRTLNEVLERSPGAWERLARWMALALVLVVVGYFVIGRGGARETRYVTQEVVRGELTLTVTATGNLVPRHQVDIGSELSGTIRAVHVDVNDSVKTGQMLAVLDTSRLKAHVLQAQSSLASAEARVVQSDASLKEARAKHSRLLKVRALSSNKLPSQQELDASEAAMGRAGGEVAAARAAVVHARANLDAVRTDFGKAEIRSPISGVVLVRTVEPGSTVAASLHAPVLFTLAEDLRKMELHVAVDEADVGSVHVEQKATFTVDAFPSRSFSAQITRVHFASSNTQKNANSSGSARTATSTGVVTYETVLDVDNPALLLRPGMTATAEIVTTLISDAILVPNAALRFVPENVKLPGEDKERSLMLAFLPTLPSRWKCPSENGQVLACVWVLEEGTPALALFRHGAGDGSMTQVIDLGQQPNGHSLARLKENADFRKALERKLKPGMTVIVGSELEGR